MHENSSTSNGSHKSAHTSRCSSNAKNRRKKKHFLPYTLHIVYVRKRYTPMSERLYIIDIKTSTIYEYYLVCFIWSIVCALSFTPSSPSSSASQPAAAASSKPFSQNNNNNVIVWPYIFFPTRAHQANSESSEKYNTKRRKFDFRQELLFGLCVLAIWRCCHCSLATCALVQCVVCRESVPDHHNSKTIRNILFSSVFFFVV